MNMPWNKSDSSSNSSRVYREIDLRLRSLPFSDFQQIVLMWLSAKGYQHIKSLGRRFKRGRRHTGGADFTAIIPDSDLEVAIQIRHWATPVTRRAVDELRGYLHRKQIPVGFIITSSSFSICAIRTAMQYPGHPIRFYSRNRLSAWLVCSGLAVRKVGNREEVDEGFFRVLSSLRLASALSFSAKDTINEDKGEAELKYLDTHKPSSLKVVLAIFLSTMVVIALSVWGRLGGN